MPEWIIKAVMWVVGGLLSLIMIIGGSFIRSDRQRLKQLEDEMKTKASADDHKDLQKKLSHDISEVHKKVEAQGVEIRASMAEQSRTMNQGFKDLQDTIIKYMGNGRD